MPCGSVLRYCVVYRTCVRHCFEYLDLEISRVFFPRSLRFCVFEPPIVAHSRVCCHGGSLHLLFGYLSLARATIAVPLLSASSVQAPRKHRASTVRLHHGTPQYVRMVLPKSRQGFKTLWDQFSKKVPRRFLEELAVPGADLDGQWCPGVGC